uniref:PC3-like endoprotease variant B n=1 Tax=Lygus hesperus TaxID=30085 RepID=A0A0A9WSN2_LYGHE
MCFTAVTMGSLRTTTSTNRYNSRKHSTSLVSSYIRGNSSNNSNREKTMMTTKIYHSCTLYVLGGATATTPLCSAHCHIHGNVKTQQVDLSMTVCSTQLLVQATSMTTTRRRTTTTEVVAKTKLLI